MGQVKRYDHVKPNDSFKVPERDERVDAALDRALEAHLGPCDNVFHELISQTVHLDLFPYRPPGRDQLVVMTRGVSDQATHPPEGAQGYRWVELFVRLPADWGMPGGEDQDEARWWPYRTLKTLGRFLHAYRTWFGPLHTVPNGNPPEPYVPGTALCGVLLVVPEGADAPLAAIDAAGRTVQMLELVPLTADEMAFKLERGGEELLDRLRAAGVIGRPLDLRRASVVSASEAADAGAPSDGGGELMAAAAMAIAETRSGYVAAQRRFGLLDRWRGRLRPPRWLDADDRLRAVYRDEWALRSRGTVVWGHIVQANQQLFAPGPDDHPAAVLYSTDPWYDRHLDELSTLCAGLYEIKGERADDPELQRFADLLEDELERQLRLPLPKKLTGGRSVYYTTVMVHRAHLPVPVLAVPFFPLLIAPGETEAAAILPANHWSRMMLGMWLAMAQPDDGEEQSDA